jgi:hypothetical protein
MFYAQFPLCIWIVYSIFYNVLLQWYSNTCDLFYDIRNARQIIVWSTFDTKWIDDDIYQKTTF